MKKRIKIAIFVLLSLLFVTRVDALSVSNNSLSVDAGSSASVELYANVGDSTVSSVTFKLVYSSNDAKASFSVASGYTDDVSNSYHTVSFGENKTGEILLGVIKVNTASDPTETEVSVTVNNASANVIGDENITLNNKTVNITINNVVNTNVVETTTTKTTSKATTKSTTKSTNKTTTTTTTTKNVGDGLLKSINSKIVKIDLKKDVFEYSVDVDREVTELDLVPVTDDDVKVDITSQKIAEITDNKIIISLKKDEKEEKYIINVKLVDKKVPTTYEIDTTEFVSDGRYKSKWLILIIGLAVVTVPILLLTKKK